MPTIAPGLDFWTGYNWKVPVGLLPGEYTLSAVVYHLDGDELRPAKGANEFGLGAIHVDDSGYAALAWLPKPTLGPCLSPYGAPPAPLHGVVGSIITLDTVWEVRCRTSQGLSLRYVSQDGQRVWDLGEVTLGSTQKTSEWQVGQLVSLRARLRLPPDLPEGQYDIDVKAVDTVTGRDLRQKFGILPLPRLTSRAGTIVVKDRPRQIALPPMRYTSGAEFGNTIRLIGYDRADGSVVSGEPITVTLAWQGTQVTDVSYSVFVQLLGQDAELVAQRDAVPGGGAVPTDTWLTGEVVVDTYSLISDGPVKPGNYSLIVGLYDPLTMKRLPLNGTAGQYSADHLTLGNVHVIAAPQVR